MPIRFDFPLELGTNEATSFLKSLQGNILESHRRDHARHYFISFGNPKDSTSHASTVAAACQWIRTILDRGDISSAYSQYKDSEQKGIFTSLLFSAEGYRFLVVGNAGRFTRAKYGYHPLEEGAILWTPKMRFYR